MDLSLQPYRQPRYVTCLDLGASGALFTTGWDRKIDLQGSKAKALKRSIVTDGIAPPRGSRAEILAAAAIDAE
jgi:NADH dehydrogenase